MARNFLKRRFTTREIILMLVLLAILFVGLYFWLVYYPINDKIAEVEKERDDLQLQLAVLHAREEQYDKWSKELEEIYKIPESDRTYMPEYNNVRALADEFGKIFQGLEPSISYPSAILNEDETVYIRTVQFSFKIEGVDSPHFATDYKKARDVLDQLTHLEYRNLLTSLNISPSDRNGEGNIYTDSLTISCTMIFYELA